MGARFFMCCSILVIGVGFFSFIESRRIGLFPTCPFFHFAIAERERYLPSRMKRYLPPRISAIKVYLGAYDVLQNGIAGNRSGDHPKKETVMLTTPPPAMVLRRNYLSS